MQMMLHKASSLERLLQLLDTLGDYKKIISLRVNIGMSRYDFEKIPMIILKHHLDNIIF